MTTPTFKQLVDFILANRKDKVFIGYDIPQIVTLLDEGIKDKCLYYSVSPEGIITGMILAKISTVSKVLWIEENLAMSLNNLKEFAKKAKAQFPDYKFQGIKHGRIRKFDNLFNHLTKD